MPFRIVGSHEYLSALSNLIPLTNGSTAEELEVYNSIVAQQDEFSFFSGVVLAAANNQEYRKDKKGPLLTEGFRRRGLAWLMALARVELGATLSMYGKVPSSFDVMAPDGFGRSEYFNLLVNDVAVHVNALKTDPLLLKKSGKKAGADSETAAYWRRLKIVNDMLLSARTAENGKFLESANFYLAAVNRFAKLLERNARLATKDSVETSTSFEDSSRTTSSTTTTPVRGTVRAVSPITRACQRSFLGRYGRQPGR